MVHVLVRMRLLLDRRRAAVWADARAQMRFVVGDDQPDEVIDRLAAAYVKRMIWRGESRWHPELVTRQPIDGLEHLQAVHRSGRGCIVSLVHHGDYEGLGPSLTWAGIPSLTVATSVMFASEVPIWMQQQRRVLSANGAGLLDVAEGSPGIKAVLATGMAVLLAADIPGHSPVRFLGHDVHVTSGPARIAKEADVPVVVVTAHRDPASPDGCARVDVSPPLDPRDFDTAEDLLEAIMSLHEPAVLAWPEAAEYPLRRFSEVV